MEKGIGQLLTLGNIMQCTPDVVLDARFLGGVSEVLALLDLEVGVGRFPVVGDCIDGIRVLDSLGKRGLVIEVGLGPWFRQRRATLEGGGDI